MSEPAITPASTSTRVAKPRQACDSCRFRKVRCDRGQPCRRCKAASLRCDYLRAVGKTGPRCGQGRRQVQLRQGLVPCDDNSLSLGVFCAVTVAPSAPPVVATNRRVESSTVAGLQGSCSSVGSHDDDQQQQQQQSNQRQRDQGWTTTCTPPPGTEPQSGGVGGDGVLSHDDTFTLNEELNDPTTPFTVRDERYYCQGLSDALAAHIRVFLKYLFPIMPIVDHRFVDDALRLQSLPPCRYGAIAAICAATRVQLRMDNSKNGTGDGPDAEIPLKPLVTEEMLIGLAESALRQYSVIDDLGLDSVLSSFFLFATYGNLNNPRHSWFYLDQAISLAHALEITSEAGYRDLEHAEQERRRRLFWVLFVTERTFALQHRRGVRLRDSTAVPKPQIIDSDCPVVMHDFVNHIRVFEQLPAALYSWCQEESGSSSGNSQQLLTLPPVINRKLCGLSPDKSVIESQRLDTTLTQQWLRIAMWRLTFGQNPLPFFPGRSNNNHNNALLLPVDLPMDAAKVLMSALSSVGPKSRDCHGIGLEQKLFDIGVSLADAARISAWDTSSALQVGPRELLSCIVESLSSARGCPSHLLPNLLRHSEDLLLQPCSPVPVVNLQWHLDQAVAMGEHHSSHAAVEELMEGTEPCSQDWLGDDLAGFQSMHAQSLAGVCDDNSDLGTSFGGTTSQVDL